MSISAQEFLKLAESFKEVTPQEAEELLESEQGTSVFVGRETCPFCCTFMPKLHQVAQDNDKQIYFVHSHHPDYTDELGEFRNKYNVPTVPGLLHSDSGEVKVRCESGMSDDEIKSFLNL